MRIDHLVYAVADIERAAERFADEYRLAATGGGEHPEFGTRNEVIPVGPGQYIELMTVADPASTHPLARTLADRVELGDGPLALCLRPESLDAVAGRLGIEAAPGERHNPGGQVLRWRLAGIEAALGPERLPFFIDWQGAEEELDRRHAEAASTAGIAWVEHGGDRERVAAWVGDGHVPLRFVDGEPGPRAIGLERGSETVVIR